MTPLIWDAHSCVPLHPNADLNILERHRSSGFSFVSINVGMDFNPVEQILRSSFFSATDRQLFFMIAARSTKDVVRAHQKVFAVAFDLEGIVPLLDNPQLIQLYWDQAFGKCLAYNRTSIVEGATIAQGLTDLGRGGQRDQQSRNADGRHPQALNPHWLCSLSSKPVYSHANPVLCWIWSAHLG